MEENLDDDQDTDLAPSAAKIPKTDVSPRVVAEKVAASEEIPEMAGPSTSKSVSNTETNNKLASIMPAANEEDAIGDREVPQSFSYDLSRYDPIASTSSTSISNFNKRNPNTEKAEDGGKIEHLNAKSDKSFLSPLYSDKEEQAQPLKDTENSSETHHSLKVDPLKALGADAFRQVLLTLHKATNLAEIIALLEVSPAWSQAVTKALDSQTELFYFRKSWHLKVYHSLLLANSLLDDPFYKIPADKPSEVIDSYHNYIASLGSALPSCFCCRCRSAPPPVSFGAMIKALTNITKLVVVIDEGMDEIASDKCDRNIVSLLDGLAFHLESLVISFTPPAHRFDVPLSIMARLKRLELYSIDLSALDLNLLRVVLSRLEHLVLGNRYPPTRDAQGRFQLLVSQDTWTKLLGYLKPGQLTHLGLVGFTGLKGHFPWEALFDELPVGRCLAAGLTSLQLGMVNLADLKAVAQLFGPLARLNFSTEIEENLTLSTIFTTLAPLAHLADLRIRLEQETSKAELLECGLLLSSHPQMIGSPKLPSVISFTMTAPKGVDLRASPRLPALLGHFLPNLLQLHLYDHAWAGGSNDEACDEFERRLAAPGREVAVNWTGDYHQKEGVFPRHLLKEHRLYELPPRCSSFFCDAAVHYVSIKCEQKMQQFKGLMEPEVVGGGTLLDPILQPQLNNHLFSRFPPRPTPRFNDDVEIPSTAPHWKFRSPQRHHALAAAAAPAVQVPVAPAIKTFADADWDLYQQAWIYEDCRLRHEMKKRLMQKEQEGVEKEVGRDAKDGPSGSKDNGSSGSGEDKKV